MESCHRVPIGAAAGEFPESQKATLAIAIAKGVSSPRGRQLTTCPIGPPIGGPAIQRFGPSSRMSPSCRRSGLSPTGRPFGSRGSPTRPTPSRSSWPHCGPSLLRECEPRRGARGGRGSVRAGIGTRLARRLALPDCLRSAPCRVQEALRRAPFRRTPIVSERRRMPRADTRCTGPISGSSDECPEAIISGVSRGDGIETPLLARAAERFGTAVSRAENGLESGGICRHTFLCKRSFRSDEPRRCTHSA